MHSSISIIVYIHIISSKNIHVHIYTLKHLPIITSPKFLDTDWVADIVSEVSLGTCLVHQYCFPFKRRTLSDCRETPFTDGMQISVWG